MFVSLERQTRREEVAVRVVSSVKLTAKAKEEMVQREWSCGEEALS